MFTLLSGMTEHTKQTRFRAAQARQLLDTGTGPPGLLGLLQVLEELEIDGDARGGEEGRLQGTRRQRIIVKSANQQRIMSRYSAN